MGGQRLRARLLGSGNNNRPPGLLRVGRIESADGTNSGVVAIIRKPSKVFVQLPLSTRAAVVQRAQAVLGEDRPAPRTWADLNVTEQLKVATSDPELAQILRDRMPPALELLVLNGKLPAVAPAVKTAEQLRAEASRAAEEKFLANRQQERELRASVQEQLQAQAQDAYILSLNLPRLQAHGG